MFNGKIRVYVVPEKIRLRVENLLKLKFEKFSLTHYTHKDGMLKAICFIFFTAVCRNRGR